jgi:hypothetical protein
MSCGICTPYAGGISIQLSICGIFIIAKIEVVCFVLNVGIKIKVNVKKIWKGSSVVVSFISSSLEYINKFGFLVDRSSLI